METLAYIYSSLTGFTCPQEQTTTVGEQVLLFNKIEEHLFLHNWFYMLHINNQLPRMFEIQQPAGKFGNCSKDI